MRRTETAPLALLALLPLLAACPPKIIRRQPVAKYDNVIPERPGRQPASANEPPFWGVGVSQPLLLYAHRSGGAIADLPPYCLSSYLFLAELHRQINRSANLPDQTAEAGRCSSEIVEHADRGEELHMRCRLRQFQNGCRDLYTATLWTEQSTASTANFRIRATAWMYRSCRHVEAVGGAVFDVSGDGPIMDIAGRPSASFGAFIDKCRPSTPPNP